MKFKTMTKQTNGTVRKLFLLILLPVFGMSFCLNGQQRMSKPEVKNNLAYFWGDVAMKCTANDTERFRPRPTVTSRYLGLISTAIFDAWSRFDDKAIPVYLHGVSRRPLAERTLSNKEAAISYAAYQTMMQYFVADSAA